MSLLERLQNTVRTVASYEPYGISRWFVGDAWWDWCLWISSSSISVLLCFFLCWVTRWNRTRTQTWTIIDRQTMQILFWPSQYTICCMREEEEWNYTLLVLSASISDGFSCFSGRLNTILPRYAVSRFRIWVRSHGRRLCWSGTQRHDRVTSPCHLVTKKITIRSGELGT